MTTMNLICAACDVNRIIATTLNESGRDELKETQTSLIKKI